MLLDTLGDALAEAVRRNGWETVTGGKRPPIEVPRDPRHGDLATNLALSLAKQVKEPPRQVAEKLISAIPLGEETLAGIEIAGPGFINFRLSHDALHKVLLDVLKSGDRYGESSFGEGLSIQVEFVSANPTGPLNIVNARAAAVGDALVHILRAAGFKSSSEYYVNDAGRQVDLLGLSFQARYRESRGEEVAFPEDGYQGEYVRELAREFPEEKAEAALGDPEAQEFRRWALDRMVSWQKSDLTLYGVHFDRWFLESELHETDRLEEALRLLQERGHVFEEEGAKWFRSTSFGDEKDRVLVRTNGEPTYFLGDIAYHYDKYRRGFEKVIDLWGPDHHGHISRMQGALKALGLPEGFLEIEIVQWVKLLSAGEPVKMSKRAGEFITLKDLIEEVGRDNARYFFLMRSTNSHLDFDLEVAKAQNDENPAYYIQYAHARVCSVLRYAEEHGISEPADKEGVIRLLVEAEELTLIKDMVLYPQVIQGAARAREPHRIPTYLTRVAESFHRFYHHHRVVTEDHDLSGARLLLCKGARQVIANGLTLLGVSAPERM